MHVAEIARLYPCVAGSLSVVPQSCRKSGTLPCASKKQRGKMEGGIDVFQVHVMVGTGKERERRMGGRDRTAQQMRVYCVDLQEKKKRVPFLEFGELPFPGRGGASRFVQWISLHPPPFHPEFQLLASCLHFSKTFSKNSIPNGPPPSIAPDHFGFRAKSSQAESTRISTR